MHNRGMDDAALLGYQIDFDLFGLLLHCLSGHHILNYTSILRGLEDWKLIQLLIIFGIVRMIMLEIKGFVRNGIRNETDFSF